MTRRARRGLCAPGVDRGRPFGQRSHETGTRPLDSQPRCHRHGNGACVPAYVAPGTRSPSAALLQLPGVRRFVSESRMKRVALALALVAAALVTRPLPVSTQTDPALVGQWSGVRTWPAIAVHSHLLNSG